MGNCFAIFVAPATMLSLRSVFGTKQEPARLFSNSSEYGQHVALSTTGLTAKHNSY